jgi:hypothetical protein
LKKEDMMNVAVSEDLMMQDIRYWADKQDELGFVSRWSLGEGTRMETKIFTDKERVVTYTVYARNVTIEQLMDGTAKKVTFSAIAKNGTVAELYRAGETLIKNAMDQESNWHIFIEDFTMQADGSLAMTTGS